MADADTTIENPPSPGAQELPVPTPGDEVAWVRAHLADLCVDDVAASASFRGGQSAADAALDGLDVGGYARRRSLVDPKAARGASRLSPYIRHGLLVLRRVWDRAEEGSGNDRFRYQGELLWQDYARHWYALYGRATAAPVLYEPVRAERPWPHEPWWREMACMARTLDELEGDGWCVNQTRMWLASQYSVRGHGHWPDGEDHMFRHLLDGSRAANRLGWQWCAGTMRSRAQGFAKAQVTRRAKAFCQDCSLRDACPIGGYARTRSRAKVDRPAIVDLDVAFGPPKSTTIDAAPEAVWLTAESLGDADPALAAHPTLPAWFVFDEALLRRLRLSSKRLVFLTETLADLATRRRLHLWLGDPGAVIDTASVAVTHAPVPGFRRIANGRARIEQHPWPWLRPPTPAYRTYLADKARPPSFRDFCRLTKPSP